MLAQLSTLKARLPIDAADTQYDALLTNAIKAVSARFDQETNRILARTEDVHHEFPADETELCVGCYPIESVGGFELKTNENDGWNELDGVDYLIRNGCVISLSSPLAPLTSALARVTYTGGYVLPGTDAGDGQTPLPDDLEQAAVEQVVFWFQNRDKVGVIREWPKGGTYEQFADIDLLPGVRVVLAKYTRMVW